VRQNALYSLNDVVSGLVGTQTRGDKGPLPTQRDDKPVGVRNAQLWAAVVLMLQAAILTFGADRHRGTAACFFLV